jgi:predicted HicB family RNase H-like nuclease
MVKKKPRRTFGKPLQVRVAPDQLELFRQAADKDGRSVSNWARDRLEKCAKGELSK